MFETSEKLGMADTVKNKKNSFLEEGEYVLCISRHLPWAWAKADVKLPYRAKKIVLVGY